MSAPARASVGVRPKGAAGPTVEFRVHLRNGNRGRQRLSDGGAPTPEPVAAGNVPRIARLMALAIRFDGLIRQGAVRDYADLARLGHVSRARLSQVMDLTLLAPDIQEEILHLPRTMRGRDAVTERQVRSIAAVADWRKQRTIWRALRVGAGRSSVPLDTSQRGAA